MRDLIGTTFRSLRVRNFRLFFIGQLVSSIGLWMQHVAELWLILELSGSATNVGLVTVTHFGPILVLGLWGGVIADRFDKRTIMLVTQPLLGLVAAGLALFSASGRISLTVLYVFSALTGLVLALDNPTRRAFVRDMVDVPDIPNAVSLFAMLVTSARIIGPAISGLLLAGSGATLVFTVNAVSYLAVFVALLLMRTDELFRVDPAAKGRGQLREGLRYAWSTPGIRLPLVMMAWIATLSFNFSVLLVVIAEQVLAAGSDGFGMLVSLSAVGSMAGALMVASRPAVSHRFIVIAAVSLGAVSMLAATAPTLVTMALALIPVGAAAIAFLSSAQAATQSAAVHHMQGRVMALFAVIFLGSTPIGGMFAGVQAEVMGARVAFATGGLIALLTGAWAWRAARRIAEAEAAATA